MAEMHPLVGNFSPSQTICKSFDVDDNETARVAQWLAKSAQKGPFVREGWQGL